MMKKLLVVKKDYHAKNVLIIKQTLFSTFTIKWENATKMNTKTL